MNQHLQTILNIIQQAEHLTDEEKAVLSKAAKNADKELEITAFKLDRTEKVKHTTAILLEETIEELEQKRKAVEVQNRELEIEGSLERVRTIAMSMNKADDMPDVCKAIAQQLELLNVKEIRNVQTAIFYKEKGTYMNYEYYAKHDKTFITDTSYTNNEMHKAFAAQMMKGAGEFFASSMNGDEVKDWIVYQKTTNVFIDTFLETASSLNYYWYSLGPVALGISTYMPLTENETNLFRRFLKVFELSYRRYLDIEKAEAQSREAQIELALERVRARTMAMQHSDELKEAAALLFQQVKSLGAPAYSCGYNIWEKDEKEFTSWMSTQDGSIINGVPNIPLTEDANFIRYVESKQNGEPFFVLELRGERMQEHYEYLKTIPSFKAYFDYAISVGFDLPETQIHHLANFSQGNLLFITLQPCPEFHDVFKRFAAVFEQTYTRFLDLQTAEAQARESQIQLALERVRARTMAMQHSDELSETALLLFEQVQSFGVALWSCGFNISEKGEKECTSFITRSGKMLSPVKVSLTENSSMQLIYEFREKGVDFWYQQMAAEEIKELYSYIARQRNKNNPGDNQFLTGVTLPAFQIAHFVNFLHGNLMFITLEAHPEMHDIFKRLGNVFEQTHTRFLDLQKAEAQAKEAQIETSLERVRSKTMAMHKHDDLLGVLDLLVEQLIKLGVQLEVANFSNGIPNGDWDLWIEVVADDGTIFNNNVHFPRIDHPYFHHVEKNIETFRNDGTDLFKDVFSKEEKASWMDYIHTQTIYKDLTSEEIKQSIYDKPGYTWSMVILKDTWVSICRFNTIPFSDEEDALLRRFANAFGQTYTRFLDLQKAEAQARESQIQLALERVRARTMAMQKSNELSETAYILFQQFKDLGEDPIQITIGIFNEDKKVVQFSITGFDGSGSKIDQAYNMDIDESILLHKIYTAWKKQKKSVVIELAGKELNDWIAYRSKIAGLIEPVTFNADDRRFVSVGFFSKGMISFSKPDQIPEKTIKILERFATVFDQTYTRFLDLQKAEAQTREAQIELGLERVRARAMAMQTSEELNALIGIVFTELTKLDLVLTRCVIIIYDAETKGAQWWMANSEAPSAPMNFFVKYANLSFFNVYLKGWEERDLKWQYILEGENKIVTDNFLFNKTELKTLPDFVIEGMKAPHKVYLNASFNNFGNLTLATLEPLSEKHFDILLRFAKVFDLTYTRFNDLQKAEAQAREAQIQLALERVRARTMAMYKSEELAEVAEVLYNQLKDLGDDPERITIGIMNEDNRVITWWATDQGGSKLNIRFQATADEPTVMLKLYNNWKAKHTSLVIDLTGPELSQWVKYCREVIGVPINEEVLQNRRVQTAGFFSHGCVMITSPHLPDAETINILERFATVFDLTYIRFLDLQKAEAQTRETQIQLALERVRAKTMAMHSSEDVTSATETMFDELKKLGINNIRGGITNIHPEKTMDVFGITNMIDGKTMKGFTLFDMNEHPIFQRLFESWNNKDEVFIDYLAGQEKEDYINVVNSHQNYLPQSIVEFPDTHFQSYRFDQGTIWTYSLQPHSESDREIMKRFASGFALTYRRYQDLKQAEAQAREALIEAALEKVRGKAMAMHNSNDLSVTASLVFTELRKLGINPIRCGVGLLNRESQKAQLYSATSSGNGDSLSLVGWVQLENHPVLEKIYTSWLNNEDYFPELQGKQLQSYYQLLLAGLSVPVPDFTNEQKHYGHFVSFSVGCLYAWSDVHYNEDQIKIFKRFATIVNLTFRRYLELQKSEASAREAVKQAAVDRIRADIASMRTISDLDRITPLIWNELTILGITFIRCGVFIMDDSQQLIHTFLSTPDGKAIAAFHLPYSTPGNIQKVISHWHDNKNYIDHWDESDFTQFAEMLVQQKALSSAEEYLKTIPHGGFHLHFLPFLQGMLYVGNTNRLNEEEINLIQSVADAFSTAYARYEDFNKLEAAKQQVEVTLSELKQTQQQLVQSEKMASLGELTAGIAHEIQNPLNFVNNFSEVNQELIGELVEEVDKGNIEEVKAIANDIKDNEGKINHHGKRADAIVKGMLQHSRKSTGAKEPTDINALCDEYLRLSYHGLRAKDKSFNADFKTEFDESLSADKAGIGKINIVPQDIGRVLLNLFNNAFYAVNEKKKSYELSAMSYEPIVSVQTKKINDKVEIKVTDNGNGIPQNIIDKIFQPFFTTKPTGQGTGLGLSLAYDIVTKEHNGTIKVESKEGEGLTGEQTGSVFIIQLPVV